MPKLRVDHAGIEKKARRDQIKDYLTVLKTVHHGHDELRRVVPKVLVAIIEELRLAEKPVSEQTKGEKK